MDRVPKVCAVVYRTMRREFRDNRVFQELPVQVRRARHPPAECHTPRSIVSGRLRAGNRYSTGVARCAAGPGEVAAFNFEHRFGIYIYEIS